MTAKQMTPKAKLLKLKAMHFRPKTKKERVAKALRALHQKAELDNYDIYLLKNDQ